MNSLKIIDKFGLGGLIKLILSYVLIPFTTPFRLAQCLWSSRILLNQRPISRNNRFSPHRGINSLFYYVQELIIQKYGRNGYANELSLGKSISDFFAITRLSTYIYAHLGGALTPLLSVSCWWLGLWLFTQQLYSNAFLLQIIIILLVLTSTIFYFFAFEGLNYNAVGWLFLPIAIYGVLSQHWLLALLGFLAIAFTSFTVTFFAACACVVLTIASLSLMPILAFIPAGVKILLHFRKLIPNLKSSLVSIAEGIGMTKKGKARRQLTLGLSGGYHLGLLLFFTVSFLFFKKPDSALYCELTALLLLAIALYIINKKFSRFADEVSLYIFSATMIVIAALSVNNYFILIPFIIAINPHPIFLGFAGDSSENLLAGVPKRSPFDTEPLLEITSQFFSNLPDNCRLIELHEYSDDDYSTVFKGLRPIHELVLYAANRREINLVPDFYAIFDSWGKGFPLSRTLKQNPTGALSACYELGSPFIMILVDNNGFDYDPWGDKGFEEIARLDWDDLRPFLRGAQVLADDDKSWRIMKLMCNTDDCPSAITGGDILAMKPNYMQVKITDSSGMTTVKYIFDSRWVCNDNKNVTVQKSDGEWPWIVLKGAKNDIVTLQFV
jgi:hypothetical protein